MKGSRSAVWAFPKV